MISFRLTDEEFVRFHNLSLSYNLRNISDLVRMALDHLLDELSPVRSGSLPEVHQRVENLESSVADLIATVNRLEARLILPAAEPSFSVAPTAEDLADRSLQNQVSRLQMKPEGEHKLPK